MFDIAPIQKLYESLPAHHERARKKLGRPITLAEKILWSHLDKPEGANPERGKSFVDLRPDRVAMQDATAQMALLQLMLSGRSQTAVPTTVHCDHLIRAHTGASNDLATANSENAEVYEFLRTVSARFGIGFWKPGSGIIHQVVLENYAFPGGLMIGTDSHTPNAGGLGMVACGVGGADAVDVMAGMPWEVLYPKLIGVKLTGQASGWTSPKDVIIKLCGILTCAGGTNAIIEYFGPGVRTLSCTGQATITNMGAELGATTSTFPFDDAMADYLRVTDRGSLADLCQKNAEHLRADPEVEADPARFYDQVVEIDLSTLEPQITGPHSPDRVRAISQLGADVKKDGFSDKFKYALIGSCTNSSYEDIGRAAHIARQALAAGITKTKIPLMVTPGSEGTFQTAERDGLLEPLRKVGATVLANACGPCIGQWRRDDIQKGDKNAIVTSFNRNFARRNDGNAATEGFIASPEIVTALAFGESTSFNPLTDAVKSNGDELKFSPPTAEALPSKSFEKGLEGFIAPTKGGEDVKIAPDSERLERLTPFTAWDGADVTGLRVLVKAKGKCTTDHISPAGPWLKFRGHLSNISKNVFIGANNAWSDQPGHTVDFTSDERDVAIHEAARRLRDAGGGWIAVGDANYGEGSSREHAAMEPRLMGCRAVITKSIARIHETNLKKQGVFPLQFVNAADYDKIRERDTVTLHVSDIAEGKNVSMTLAHDDGSKDTVELMHTLSADQIDWIRAGSALNLLAKQAAG